jgi:Ribbon-helix-helix protein, copG family
MSVETPTLTPVSDTQRVSVNLPREDIDLLRRIAEQRHITMTEALRRAIAMERFIEEALRNGEKLLIEDRDGKTVRQLVIR